MTLRSSFVGFVLVAVLVMLSSTGVAYAKDDAANAIAVCGCGMIFTPDAKTEYITANGKSYACCTPACHKMASKDPEAAGKMAEAAKAEAMAMLMHTEMEVGNVIAISESGTEALCGCGMEFTISEKTKYIKADDKSYACCTDKCHAMASKDPEAAVKMFKEQLAKR